MLNEPLASVCAQQWVAANEFIMKDLSDVDRDRYTVVDYQQLSADPHQVISDICDFANIKFDKYLRERLASDLPLSRYTQTIPKPDKWKGNEQEISSASPLFNATWERIQTFSSNR